MRGLGSPKRTLALDESGRSVMRILEVHEDSVQRQGALNRPWKSIGESGMRRILLLVASLLTALLTGCGQSVATCSTPEVLETLHDAIVGGLADSPYKERFSNNLKIDGVVTLDVDKNVNAYECKANLAYTDQEGQAHNREISYGVRQVETGEENFEVTYDDARAAGFAVMSIYADQHKDAVAKSEKQAAEQAAAEEAFAKANPPIPLTKDEAVSEISSSVSNLCAASGTDRCSDLSTFDSDMNGDGLTDYVMLFTRRYVYVPYGDPDARKEIVEYKLGCAYQRILGPGKKNDLSMQELATLPPGVTPIGVGVTGSRIEVNSEDGDIVYVCKEGSKPTQGES